MNDLREMDVVSVCPHRGNSSRGHWIPTHNHGVSMPEYAVEIPLSKEAQSILTAVHSIPLVTVYSPDDTTLKLYLDPGGVTKNE